MRQSLHRPSAHHGSERDQRSFLEELAPIYHRLEAYSLSLCDSRDEAQDLIQETIVRALEGFDGIRDRQAFFSFLLTIARRLASREDQRRKRFRPLTDCELSELLASTPSPEVGYDALQVHAALRRLAPGQRMAILLHDLAGLTHGEVAATLDCSEQAARARIHRARQRLSSLLNASDVRLRPPAETVMSPEFIPLRRRVGQSA